ncbi:MAG: hypothetical protein WA019_01800, partial [Candidatus Moraniibacteriota bacterium]
IIPFRRECDFFQLLPNWEQFLIHYGQSYFFGGTDEKPFLVRINSMGSYINGGISSFYQSLIPESLNDLANQFGAKLKRQGDIFALPLPWSLREIDSHYLFQTGRKISEGGIKEGKEIQLFGTRHRIRGIEIQMNICGSGRRIGQGVIEAPDHKALVLKEWHIIMQADNLYSPTTAD